MRLTRPLLALCLLLSGAAAAAPLPDRARLALVVLGTPVIGERAPVTFDVTDGPHQHDWLHHLIGSKPHQITWWQMTVRGVLIFLFAILLVRIGKRAFERSAPIDIILSVLIGSNLSRAFTANASFLPTLIATGAIVALYWISIHAAVYSQRISLLVKGRHDQLVRHGALDRVTMARHGIAEDDLREAMRISGIHDLREVEAAYLERNGAISLLRRRA